MDSLGKTMANFLRRDVARFTAPMILLVAEGRPVALDRLAAVSEVPIEEIQSWLRAQPGTDWDEGGRLLGFGLTQRPTRHRYIVDGRVLFTFCAADTLIFTPILGRPASVESSCPTTGEPIRVELTPEAVTSVEPSTTVVSQVDLTCETSDIRGSCCDHGHFFTSENAAQDVCRRVGLADRAAALTLYRGTGFTVGYADDAGCPTGRGERPDVAVLQATWLAAQSAAHGRWVPAERVCPLLDSLQPDAEQNDQL